MKNKKIVWFSLFCVVVISGIYGLMIYEDYDLSNAIFFTLLMFFYNFGEYTTNIFVNIARYGAILLSTTAIVSFFNKFAYKIRDYFVSNTKNSTFVYGNNELSKEFINSSKYKIINREYYTKADRYVLLMNDDQNLEFYNNNIENLKDKEVFIKNSVLANTIQGKHKFFSLEQIAARKFWEENTLIDLAFVNGKAKKQLNIVFVGFNTLAEYVLYEATEINIFDPNQEVNYHIFGDSKEFRESHINSKLLNFKYYDESFLEYKKLLNKSDIILFFDSSDRLNKMLGCIEKGNVIYFAKDTIDKDLYLNHKYGKNDSISLSTFNYLQNICTESEIVNEVSLYDSKQLNANYNAKQHLYAGLTIDEQWLKLSTFHRTINTACVDYYKFTTRKLIEKKLNKNYESISDDEFAKQLDLLSELEHIRWCNYHYFCNWTFNKVTDRRKKQHNCLIPYDELSQEEKDKDTEQILKVRRLLNVKEEVQ